MLIKISLLDILVHYSFGTKVADVSIFQDPR
jgi:hypothetical protein